MKITNYNKGSNFNVNFDGREFVKLETLYNSAPQAVYRLSGLFINNKSKYGPRPYAAGEAFNSEGQIIDQFLVDLPMHMLEQVQQMLQDNEVIEEINAGIAGFSVRTYFSKTFNKDCYSIMFEELK